MKKLISLILTAAMLAEVLLMTVSAADVSAGAMPFTDVKKKQWYYEPIEEVYAEGIMQGVSETEFAPVKSLTRAETVTLLSRLACVNVEGMSESLTFKDTKKTAWYAEYVGWAAESGVVNGYDDGTFRPNAPVSRQELASLIVRFLSYMEAHLADSPKIAKYSDEGKIAGWAKENAEVMRKSGLMNGDDAGRFNPKSTATRAEMAAICVRMLPYLGRLGIVKNGASEYKIVVSAADSKAQSAAERVKEQMEYQTGASLEIVTDETSPSKYEIVLGDTNRFVTGTEGLGENGYEIRVDGDKVIVSGETEDGIYRGAVRLLSESTNGNNVTLTKKLETRVTSEYPVKSLTINGNDVSLYSVVVNGETSPATEKAVAEIIKYVKKACGVEISASSGKAGYETILDTTAPTDEESFTVKSVGNSVRISGNKLRGILYGAYDFLETCVGWRFLTNEVDFIRDSEHTDISNVDYSKHPYFDERTLLIQCYGSGDITMKRGLGVIGRSGVNYDYGGYTFTGASCHTIGPLSETGSDIEPNPCFTDEAVYETTLKNVMKLIESNPGTRLISVSINDTIAHCECEKCLAIEEEEGSPAGPMLRFVNRIADEVAKTHPEVQIHTFAYLHTQKAPKITRPRDNVQVELCSINACFAHGLFEGVCDGSNRDFSQDLKDWSAICENMRIWDYTIDFAFYTHLFPNIRYEVLVGNLRGFYENNVLGVMEQGEYNGRGTCFTELKCYLMSKAMWDPYVSEEEYYGWMYDFLEGYYGDGWQKIRESIDIYLEKMSRSCNNIYIDPLSNLLNIRKDAPTLVKLATEAKFMTDSPEKYEYADVACLLYRIALTNVTYLTDKENPEIIPESNAILDKMKKYGLRFSESYGIYPEGYVTIPPCRWKELF
ncbi:MAG: DUF4838 domain-containing protein [Clostridia bacterium]|nr:DUF4838 domain-containing protein [Clostridia bacterium]